MLSITLGGHLSMDYKIGDKVVYPNHGVGVIEQINFGVLNGQTEKYFMVRICSSGLKVMVPSGNALSVGLRPVIRNIETTKVLGFLERENRTHTTIGSTDSRKILRGCAQAR